MSSETDELSIARRRLIVHDALTFLSLASITVVLFVVTLLLFRSFAAHRDDLAKRWSDRGRVALRAGHPDQAIVALRTALSYAPGQRTYELLLAQALGDAGHTEESFNYFLGLWEATPGDGFINLRLARLAAKKGDRQGAVNFYRASIYGTWEGDGTARRRDVRLELAQYLLDQHDYNQARMDLLVAGGNNPDDMPLALRLGEMLHEAGAPADALTYYRKVIAAEPQNEAALEGAGRLEFAAGDFEEASRLLGRAARENASAEVADMFSKAQRVVTLAPAKTLPARERVGRILNARAVAKKRFESCSAQVAGGALSSLAGLGSAWTGKVASMGAGALMRDADARDAVVMLVFDTEEKTSQVCGEPSGDDAALLLMAKVPQALDK